MATSASLALEPGFSDDLARAQHSGALSYREILGFGRQLSRTLQRAAFKDGLSHVKNRVLLSLYVSRGNLGVFLFLSFFFSSLLIHIADNSR